MRILIRITFPRTTANIINGEAKKKKKNLHIVTINGLHNSLALNLCHLLVSQTFGNRVDNRFVDNTSIRELLELCDLLILSEMMILTMAREMVLSGRRIRVYDFLRGGIEGLVS